MKRWYCVKAGLSGYRRCNAAINPRGWRARGGTAVSIGLPLFDYFLNDNGTALAEGAPLPVRFGTWFWGCGINPDRWVPSTEGAGYELSPELQAMGADLFMAGWDHYITKDGVRQGQVFADTAFFFENSSSVTLVNPILMIFTETGVQQAQVTSEWGQFDRLTEEMVARRNVVLTIQEGNRTV